MSFVKNLGMTAKLTLLGAIYVVGFVTFGAMTLYTLNTVKVNGPHYQEIIQNKDLLADVLPPPVYIVEPCLVVQLMPRAKSPEALAALVERYSRLKADFEARQDYWTKNLPDGPTKQELIDKSRKPAESFFTIFDSEFLPLVKSGDVAAARAVIDAKMMPLFNQHRDVIDSIAKQVTDETSAKEASVAGIIQWQTTEQFLVGLLLLSGVCGFTLYLRRLAKQQDRKDLENAAKLAAISRAQAVIEFQLDGTILHANENFLRTLGYSLDEVKGRHHSMFVAEIYKNSAEYREFWSRLNRGEYVAGEFKRVGKGGKEIWLEASYNPVLDMKGKPFKVVKFATDTTAAKLKSADFAGQLAAISKSQAVIEFNLDGTILTANENFCKTLGYSLDEIKGRHHSMFVRDAVKHSPEYKEFWTKLNRGEYFAGEFERVGKDGKDVVIQASYNPITDTEGKLIKVVKFAADVTEMAKLRSEAARAVKENAEREAHKAAELASILDQVNANAQTLGSSAEELTAVSSQMASNAEETSAQANVVSAASEQVSKNVQTVATGVDEMNSAIREIAKNASDSARVAQQAVVDAQSANAMVSKLGDSSMEIGKVIKVITSIAEQTNLLALNATIEAARAGEAGKGFAVVANEVKELAKETAKATEDISRKIEAIQADTVGAVASIKQIGQVIVQISDISNTIASAVEEQTATAAEMARNVSEAAKGTAEIAQNITSVATTAQNTTLGANNCQQAASELARMAIELQQLQAGGGQNADPNAFRALDAGAKTSTVKKNATHPVRHEEFMNTARA